MHPGDLIIDMDSLGMAVTGQDLQGYIFQTPRSILDILMPLKSTLLDLALQYHNDGYCRNVWVTVGGARLIERNRLFDKVHNFPHRIFVLEISHNTCREHIKSDPDRGPWQLWDPLIKSWWNNYQPRKGDIVISTNDLEKFSPFSDFE